MGKQKTKFLKISVELEDEGFPVALILGDSEARNKMKNWKSKMEIHEK